MSRIDPVELSLFFQTALSIPETGFLLHTGFAGTHEGESRVWTQLTDGPEDKAGPAVDLIFTETEIRTGVGDGDAAFKTRWALKNYKLAGLNLEGFGSLLIDINAFLVSFYSRWEEQPRFKQKAMGKLVF